MLVQLSKFKMRGQLVFAGESIYASGAGTSNGLLRCFAAEGKNDDGRSGWSTRWNNTHSVRHKEKLRFEVCKSILYNRLPYSGTHWENTVDCLSLKHPLSFSLYSISHSTKLSIFERIVAVRCVDTLFQYTFLVPKFWKCNFCTHS